jgi:hypothetical protein
VKALAAGLALAALLAIPAVAQENPHANLATECYETCARFVAKNPAAAEDARQEGWNVTPEASPPRFVSALNADRTIEGLGQFILVSIIEIYPSTVSNLCLIQSFEAEPDWPDLGIGRLGFAGLKGGVQTDPDGGISGSWEKESPAGHLYLVLGRQTGHFLVQITEITPRPNQ